MSSICLNLNTCTTTSGQEDERPPLTPPPLGSGCRIEILQFRFVDGIRFDSVLFGVDLGYGCRSVEYS